MLLIYPIRLAAVLNMLGKIYSLAKQIIDREKSGSPNFTNEELSDAISEGLTITGESVEMANEHIGYSRAIALSLKAWVRSKSLYWTFIRFQNLL